MKAGGNESGEPYGRAWSRERPDRRPFWISAALHATLFVVSMLGVIVGNYPFGLVLFIATPAIASFVATLVYLMLKKQDPLHPLLLTFAHVGLSLLVLMVFALEGIICVFIASPIIVIVSIVGTFSAATLVRCFRNRTDLHRGLVLLSAFPIILLRAETRTFEPSIQTITNSIVIDAPADVVWKYIPTLTLPENPDVEEPWVFALGYGKPLRCETDGEGVGAKRRCYLNRGVYSERVTVWREGEELSFEITDQPDWVEEYIHMHHSSIRLVVLDDGRTRLERSTTFDNLCRPAWYFDWWCEEVVGGAHEYVLDHIKALAEADHAETQ